MGISKERIMNGKENGKGIKEKRDGKKRMSSVYFNLSQFFSIFHILMIKYETVRNTC